MPNIVRSVVRDYECDTQGIVNNAVYMNYCEHARNQYINSLGYSLYDLHTIHKENPVVALALLEFKHSLVGGDTYTLHTTLSLKGSMRMIFTQNIYKTGSIYDTTEEETLCVAAEVTVSVLKERDDASLYPIPIKQSVLYRLFENV